jgi:hypothetical protein
MKLTDLKHTLDATGLAVLTLDYEPFGDQGYLVPLHTAMVQNRSKLIPSVIRALGWILIQARVHRLQYSDQTLVVAAIKDGESWRVSLCVFHKSYMDTMRTAVRYNQPTYYEFTGDVVWTDELPHPTWTEPSNLTFPEIAKQVVL